MTEPDDVNGPSGRPEDPTSPAAPGDPGASTGSDGGGAPDESGESRTPEPEPAPAAPPERDGWLPRDTVTLFGEGARAEEAYGLLTVDVPPESWITALSTARDRIGCRFFDWLSAVDEPGTGFRICAHVVLLPAVTGMSVRGLLLRTTVPHEAPVLPTATGVFAGAAWHERETHEMFGVDFTGHPNLVPLLLPDSFEGHPLRKDFVLAARVAKAWPGAKEPGESDHGGPKRRQMLPPGVPDPNEWGPLKGQLPPVPSRPARGRAAAAGDRPVRRARSASAGSASQRGAGETDTGTTDAGTTDTGSANGAAEPGTSQRRDPGTGTAEQSSTAEQPRTDRPAPTGPAADGGGAEAGDRAQDPPRRAPATPDSEAPWHDARPASGDGDRDGRDGRSGEDSRSGDEDRSGDGGSDGARPGDGRGDADTGSGPAEGEA